MRFTHRQGVASLVHFFVVVAEMLLALRVFLRFFNFNPDATFVHWAYANTTPLLEPLRGVFASPAAVHRGWVVDYPALLAMALWAVAGYLFLGLVDRWVARPTGRR